MKLNANYVQLINEVQYDASEENSLVIELEYSNQTFGLLRLSDTADESVNAYFPITSLVYFELKKESMEDLTNDNETNQEESEIVDGTAEAINNEETLEANPNDDSSNSPITEPKKQKKWGFFG